jgi:hypothetical protein
MIQLHSLLKRAALSRKLCPGRIPHSVNCSLTTSHNGRRFRVKRIQTVELGRGGLVIPEHRSSGFCASCRKRHSGLRQLIGIQGDSDGAEWIMERVHNSVYLIGAGQERRSCKAPPVSTALVHNQDRGEGRLLIGHELANQAL